MGKRSLLKKTDVLNASEIGQYIYCSCAWWLQRCGHEPESPFLESGKQVHIAMGNKIDGLEGKMRYSRLLVLFGFVVLCVAFLLFSFEVIL
jgi:hypothetical protein